MKKIKLISPPILYKRPISKASPSYNSIKSQYNSIKPELELRVNSYTKEGEKKENIKIIENDKKEENNQKFKYLYSNLNNFKKLKGNSPHFKPGIYSVNNKSKNKLKRNIIEIQDDNSLCFMNKNNDSKIYPNVENNACNISLNQHFYSIDYNSFEASSSLIKEAILDNKTERIKINSKFNIIQNMKNNYKNSKYNNRNKKNNLFKNFNINVPKNIKDNYDSFDNNSNIFLINDNSKSKKRKDIISLFVNPKKQFFNTNKTSDEPTNFLKIFTQRKLKHKINKTSSLEKESYNNQTNSIDNNFKYNKKIVNHISFNSKNGNFLNHLSSNDKIPKHNYKKCIASLKNSDGRINDYNRSLKSSRFKGYKSFISNKIGLLKYKKNINLNYQNFHTNEHNNLSTRGIINRSEFKNLSANKKLSSSISILNSSLNYKRFKFNKIAINKILIKNNSISRKSLEKKNNSTNKNKINNNHKMKIIININGESSRGNKEVLNTTRPEDFRKKRINEFQINKKKLKKININELINGTKKIQLTNSNHRKIIEERFLTKENKIDKNNNLSSLRQSNLSLNKDINYVNIIPKKIQITNDKKLKINLGDELKKFKQVKNKNGKKIEINQNHLIKTNILTKHKKYIIKKFNTNSAIRKNQNIAKNSQKIKSERIQIIPESLSNSIQKESNIYMDQSIKLSKYIKNFYLKNKSYPKTNLNFYRIGKLIGQGGFAKVNLGLNVLTGRVVAIKSFNKNIKSKNGINMDMDKVLYEINLMKKLNHQNITKILETFEDDQFYFIIMEYINGGNLFSYVKKRRKLSEKVAKFLFRQIILGIKHIHSNLIVHRDIKLENILIDMNNNIKICDFGIGIILSSENQILHSHCGTPVYIAPEIITSTKDKGYKGFPVDIYSAGIVLYIMVSGRLPFDESPDDICEINKNKDMNKENEIKLKYGLSKREPKYLENMSDELRDLLKGLLNKDPNKRLNIEQILNHPWFSNVNSNKIKLFSKTERQLLYQAYIDYRKRKASELIETFTLSNLNKDNNKSNENYNCETKSSLLAPFNSFNYEYFNIVNPKNKRDEFEDFNNKKLVIENDLFSYSNKVKELNNQYEIDNNKDANNGILMNPKSINESNSSSFTNSNTNRNSIIDKYVNVNFDFNHMLNNMDYKRENILSQIENLGYDREYVIKSLKNNFLNHATTVYFLLMNYEYLS